MSSVLILGAGGMLGHKLCHELPQCGHSVFGTIRQRAETIAGFDDVYDQTKVFAGVDAMEDASLADVFSQVKPDVVVNAIGIVKQLPSANNRLISVAINSYLPHKLAQLCREQGCKLIHISTDCVFSGREGNYTEESPSDAEDFYGKSKYLGETDASESSAVTLRTSFIGPELHEKTHGLLAWFLSEQGRTVRGFRKAIYTGLTSRELSRVIAMVIESHTHLTGVYQVASEPITKYDLLHEIQNAYGLDITIEPDDALVCDRSMSGEAFAAATGYTPPSWPDMIRDMRDDPLPYDSYRNG